MSSISIVVPAYNAGHFLEIAVRSVMAQTCADWELVIVDDGSSETLLPFDEWDARIRLIRQQNSGQAVARNVGIAQTSGEFIAFLDADDVWLPQKLELQLEAMRSDPTLGLCHTQFEIVDQENRHIEDGYGGGVNNYLRLLEGCSIVTSSVMARRAALESIDGFDSGVEPSEDYDVWLRIARLYPIAGIGESLVLYRKHAQNLSSNYRVMCAASDQVLRKHFVAAARCGDRRVQSAARRGQKNMGRAFGAQALDSARAQLRRHNFVKALPHFSFALRRAPYLTLFSLCYSLTHWRKSA